MKLLKTKVQWSGVPSIVSMNTIASDPFGVEGLMGMSAVVVAQAACSGTLTLQVSNDSANIDGNTTANIANWATVLSTQTAVAGAGSYYIQLDPCDAVWMRLVWTANSGSGGNLSGNLYGRGAS